MDISSKKTFIQLLLFLSFLLIGCSSITESDTDDIVIKIGNFLVDRQQYENQLEKLTTTYDELTQEEAALFLLDNYISAGLLVEAAKKLNYEQHQDFIEKDVAYKEQLVIKYSKYLRANYSKHRMDERLIKKILQDEVWIHYIRIPKKHKELSKSMLRLMNGVTAVKDILENPEITEWNSKGLSFYGDIPLRHAILTDKLMEEIMLMQDEEVKIIKAKSAYYVVRRLLPKKLPVMDDEFGKTVQQNLLMAQSLEKGDIIFEPYRLEESIKRNEMLLSKIDFSIDPFYPDSDFVANICGRFINENEIKEKISELPVNIQCLFINRSTRVRAIATLILLNYYKEEKTEKPWLQNKDKFQEILSNTLKNNAPEDTIVFLKKWITNELEKYNNATFKDNLTYIEITDKKNKENLHNKKLYEVRDWLQPSEIIGYNQLKLNFELIEKMKITQTYTIDEQILAYSDNWSITVKDFITELDKLTPLTRAELVNNNLLSEMIQYVAKRDSGNDSQLIINSNLFESIDIMGMSYDQVNYIVEENAIVGTLGNIDLSVKEFRDLIVKMSKSKKNRLLTSDSRSKEFNELIINKFWLNLYDKKIIEDNPDFKKEILNYQNKLLVELLYKYQIQANIPQIDNEQLNIKVQYAVSSIAEDKLLVYIQTLMQDYPVLVNINFFKKHLNIDIESSVYHKVIINNIK